MIPPAPGVQDLTDSTGPAHHLEAGLEEDRKPTRLSEGDKS